MSESLCAKLSSEVLQSNEVLIHTIEDTDTYYANRLRQAMFAEVATLAIDDVHIFSNTGILIDEMLVHRLGLIVLSSSETNKETEFELKIKCQEVEITQGYMNVTADMLNSNNPDVYVVHPQTIITKLRPGEEINLKAFVKKGTGKEHAKWCPVSCVGYQTEYLENESIRITMVIESVGGLSAAEILRQAQTLIDVLRPTLNCYKLPVKNQSKN